MAALLAGIVALNVAVLRLNMQAEQLDSDQERLSTRRDVLNADLSRAASAGRIEALAAKLGFERPVQTTYVRLRPPKR